MPLSSEVGDCPKPLPLEQVSQAEGGLGAPARTRSLAHVRGVPRPQQPADDQEHNDGSEDPQEDHRSGGEAHVPLQYARKDQSSSLFSVLTADCE